MENSRTQKQSVLHNCQSPCNVVAGDCVVGGTFQWVETTCSLDCVQIVVLLLSWSVCSSPEVPTAVVPSHNQCQPCDIGCDKCYLTLTQGKHKSTVSWIVKLLQYGRNLIASAVPVWVVPNIFSYILYVFHVYFVDCGIVVGLLQAHYVYILYMVVACC